MDIKSVLFSFGTFDIFGLYQSHEKNKPDAVHLHCSFNCGVFIEIPMEEKKPVSIGKNISSNFEMEKM